MKKPMLILLLTLVAAVGLSGVASAQELVLNITIGANTSILSPTQTQTSDQAQAQAQTSNNTNTNTLTNTNINLVDSSSTATNTNTITNTNTFNPVLVVDNENEVGDITVSSSNINAQTQALILKFRRW